MKTLVLDTSKWRCGDCSIYEGNRLGVGHTRLLNDEGYMCCLGQFARQLSKDVSILNVSMPGDMNKKIPLLNEEIPISGGTIIKSSLFSRDCSEINDNEKTSIEQKLLALGILCLAEGIDLEVI